MPKKRVKKEEPNVQVARERKREREKERERVRERVREREREREQSRKSEAERKERYHEFVGHLKQKYPGSTTPPPHHGKQSDLPKQTLRHRTINMGGKGRG